LTIYIFDDIYFYTKILGKIVKIVVGFNSNTKIILLKNGTFG